MAKLESKFITKIKKEMNQKLQKEIAKENEKLQKIRDNLLNDILLQSFNNEKVENEFLTFLDKFSLSNSKKYYKELKEAYL
ncbi:MULTISPECIES: hypothetical protein [Campylobacter]|uniref:Uncharacterized protein n=2 Tax=Campylobacter helveticus TaxID=28898 RepID=A0AAX2UJ10_9BACT|nr:MULTISPECIES: hypothetical protein [Campylobacter]EEY3086022.1 hypothetical protein [Campylobacter jejuni]ARE81505.1 hypothetical protein CHELV3228_b0042 [Campylobacter helveticus]EAI3917916.1 hypothetical protein [Campylobacter upsaliensis]EAI4345287.1 hypothetical protein [Campylobacter upsaliensis]EAJ0879418.1 hypothetical protein [Campylobacter upsaliensis]